MYDDDNTYIKIISAPFRLYLDRMRISGNTVKLLLLVLYTYRSDRHKLVWVCDGRRGHDDSVCVERCGCRLQDRDGAVDIATFDHDGLIHTGLTHTLIIGRRDQASNYILVAAAKKVKKEKKESIAM